MKTKTEQPGRAVSGNESGASRVKSDRTEDQKGGDAMKGFKPGPGNTGSMDGTDESGRKQVGNKI